MNFFEHQDRSRKKTLQLVTLFTLGVAAIIAAVYGVVAIIEYFYLIQKQLSLVEQYRWFDTHRFVLVALCTLGVIAVGSYVKIRCLARGGSYIAQSMGGDMLDFATRDPHERKYINVVQEMAIASGVPVPLIYLLNKEAGINAFAAGYTPEDAVIAVTRGSIETLSRDELQGVVAHEYSHILNGDMRLNIRLIGILSGITAIGVIGKQLLGGPVRARRVSLPLMLAGLALTVIGYGGLFINRMIQSAISRQREFLADASAVQFTRNPEGLSGALKKIGGFASGSYIDAPAAEETRHMFFSNALDSFFATHPPLKERIRRIDRSFRGMLKERSSTTAGADAVQSFSEGTAAAQPQPGPPPLRHIDTIGTLTPAQMSLSSQLLAEMPEQLLQELQTPLGAIAVVCALLFDTDPAQRGLQLKQLRTETSPQVMDELRTLAPMVQKIERHHRLPAVDLALPALRRLSLQQYQRFMRMLAVLINADAAISLFEFALYTVVKHRLEKAFRSPAKAKQPQPYASLNTDLLTLIAALAYAGHRKANIAAAAYKHTIATIKNIADGTPMPSAAAASFRNLGSVLNRLRRASPKNKQTIFAACERCVNYDRQVTLEEAELLRAIAYALDLPLPPFLPGTTG